jgi:hypothetical protein
MTLFLLQVGQDATVDFEGIGGSSTRSEHETRDGHGRHDFKPLCRMFLNCSAFPRMQ